MTDIVESQIFGLIAAAQDQQAVVKAALAGLAAQEAALAQERLRLAETITLMRQEFVAWRRVAGAIGPEVQHSAEQAVRAAVAESMAGASGAAAGMMDEATQPLLARFAGVVSAAEAVEGSLRRVVGWVTWRLLGRAVAVLAGLVLLMVVSRIGLAWWTDRGVTFARADRAIAEAQKSVLETDIAGLQDTRDQLLKLGARATILRCGEASRPCIRIDESKGAFAAGGNDGYRVIQGY